MARTDERKVRRLDGTLLLVFRELMRQRTATAAGARLGLSQSGVSHALGRLREVFEDPLFLRRPRGLEPTRRALELAPKIEALLVLVEDAVGAQAEYDPLRSNRQFHVGSADNLIPMVARDLIQSMEADSPNASVIFKSVVGSKACGALLRGEIDLAIGAFGPVPEGLSREILIEDEFALIARAGHPELQAGIDRNQFCELPHILVSPSGTAASPLETHLAEQGLRRRIMAIVPRFMTAFAITGSTDALLIAPSRLARLYTAAFGLEVHPLPGRPIITKVDMLQRESQAKDPAVEWLARRMRAALSSLELAG